MYVHIGTIYIKWPGVFQSLACPAQLWSFVCVTCTRGWSNLLLYSNRYRWKLCLLLLCSWSLSLQWTPSKPCIRMGAHWPPRPIHKWSPQRDQLFPDFWTSFLSLLPVCVKGGWEKRGPRPKASGLMKGFCCQRLFFMSHRSLMQWGLHRKPEAIHAPSLILRESESRRGILLAWPVAERGNCQVRDIAAASSCREKRRSPRCQPTQATAVTSFSQLLPLSSI